MDVHCHHPFNGDARTRDVAARNRKNRFDSCKKDPPIHHGVCARNEALKQRPRSLSRYDKSGMATVSFRRGSQMCRCMLSASRLQPVKLHRGNVRLPGPSPITHTFRYGELLHVLWASARPRRMSATVFNERPKAAALIQWSKAFSKFKSLDSLAKRFTCRCCLFVSPQRLAK